MNRVPLVLVWLCVGCSGSIDTGSTAETEAPIIGGSTDPGDPAVVALYTGNGSLCTATVVSPTVLLTAAHCVSPQTVGNTTFRAFFGPNLDKQMGGTWIDVKETHYDTLFNVNNLSGGHDIAVAILASPTSVTPIPINRSSTVSGLTGQPVRLVGYGNDNGSAGTGAGLKRQTTTTLVEARATLLHIGNSQKETCNGDSGGPAFMDFGGVAKLVGVTSYGQVGCTGGGWDTRVDVYGTFLDTWVKTGTTPPPTCTPSCGTKTCGDDGCGGTCGTCAGGSTCSAGQCVANPPPPSGTSCDANGGWESEPNDNPAGADVLCSDGHIDAAIESSGDVDWYSWKVGANHDYYVTLSYLPADYTMTLYKVVGSSLSPVATAPSSHNLANQQIARHTSDGGTYYLGVSGVSGAFDDQYGYRVTVQIR
jgi:V8-like Glu-specific endopeptidase